MWYDSNENEKIINEEDLRVTLYMHLYKNIICEVGWWFEILTWFEIQKNRFTKTFDFNFFYVRRDKKVE